MPHLTAATFRRLHEAAAGHDGAVLVDPDGRRQLAFVVDPARLDAVRPGLSRSSTTCPLHRCSRRWTSPRCRRRRRRAPRRRHLGGPARPAGRPRPSSRSEGLPSGPVPGHIWSGEPPRLDRRAVRRARRRGRGRRGSARRPGEAAPVTTSSRAAGPVTAFLLGVAAGEQDADPEAVERLAARAQALAEGWDRPADAPDPDDIVDDDPRRQRGRPQPRRLRRLTADRLTACVP